MNPETFNDLMEPQAPAVEHNDLIIELSESQERDLQMAGITMIDGNYYLSQHFSSSEFSEVYVRCSNGLLIGQSERMFHLIKFVV